MGGREGHAFTYGWFMLMCRNHCNVWSNYPPIKSKRSFKEKVKLYIYVLIITSQGLLLGRFLFPILLSPSCRNLAFSHDTSWTLFSYLGSLESGPGDQRCAISGKQSYLEHKERKHLLADLLGRGPSLRFLRKWRALHCHSFLDIVFMLWPQRSKYQRAEIGSFSSEVAQLS